MSKLAYFLLGLLGCLYMPLGQRPKELAAVLGTSHGKGATFHNGMMKWGLLGLLLILSQWIIPFPTFSTSFSIFWDNHQPVINLFLGQPGHLTGTTGTGPPFWLQQTQCMVATIPTSRQWMLGTNDRSATEVSVGCRKIDHCWSILVRNIIYI